jgi:predicted DNA-binding transcriptional regulator YafY
MPIQHIIFHMLPLKNLMDKLDKLYRINDFLHERRGKWTNHKHIAAKMEMSLRSVADYLRMLKMLGAPMRSIKTSGMTYCLKDGETWTFTLTNESVKSFIAKRKLWHDKAVHMHKINKARRESKLLQKRIKAESV